MTGPEVRVEETALRAPRIFRNVVILSAANLLNLLLFGANSILLANVLGKVYMGRYTAVVAVVQLFAALVDLGLSSVVLRDLSRHPPDDEVARILGSSARLRIKLGLIAYFLLAVVVWALRYPFPLAVAALVLGLTMFTSVLFGSVLAVSRAWERMELDSAVTVGMAALNLLLTYVILTSGYGIRLLAAATVGVNLLGGLILYWLCRRNLMPIRFTPDPVLQRSIFAAAWPFGIGGVLFMAYDRIDILILYKIAGDAATGDYAVAYSLLGVIKILSGSVIGAVLPALSKLSDEASVTPLLATSTTAGRLMCVLGCGGVAVTWITADEVMRLLYGATYATAADLLRILSFSGGIIFVGQVFGNLLVSRKLSREYAIASLLGLVVNLGLNLTLVPRYAATGAAVTTVATDGVVTLVIVAIVHARVAEVPLLVPMLRASAAAWISYQAWALLSPYLPMLLLLPLACALYLILLYATGGITAHELRMMSGWPGPRKGRPPGEQDRTS